MQQNHFGMIWSVASRLPYINSQTEHATWSESLDGKVFRYWQHYLALLQTGIRLTSNDHWIYEFIIINVGSVCPCPNFNCGLAIFSPRAITCTPWNTVEWICTLISLVSLSKRRPRNAPIHKQNMHIIMLENDKSLAIIHVNIIWSWWI